MLFFKTNCLILNPVSYRLLFVMVFQVSTSQSPETQFVLFWICFLRSHSLKASPPLWKWNGNEENHLGANRTSPHYTVLTMCFNLRDFSPAPQIFKSVCNFLSLLGGFRSLFKKWTEEVHLENERWVCFTSGDTCVRLYVICFVKSPCW